VVAEVAAVKEEGKEGSSSGEQQEEIAIKKVLQDKRFKVRSLWIFLRLSSEGEVQYSRCRRERT